MLAYTWRARARKSAQLILYRDITTNSFFLRCESFIQSRPYSALYRASNKTPRESQWNRQKRPKWQCFYFVMPLMVSNDDTTTRSLPINGMEHGKIWNVDVNSTYIWNVRNTQHWIFNSGIGSPSSITRSCFLPLLSNAVAFLAALVNRLRRAAKKQQSTTTAEWKLVCQNRFRCVNSVFFFFIRYGCDQILNLTW